MVSAIALLFAAVVVVTALRRGTFVQLFPCVGVPLVATAVMLAAMKRARAATVGGDVVWIVKEQELEIRSGAQRRAFALRSFVKCRHTGSIMGTWHRLLLSRGFWSTSAGPSIWLRRREVDAPALKVEIERRLERRPWWRWR